MHLLTSTGIKMNALKAANCDLRCTWDRREVKVQLHDFIAGHLATIRHGYISTDRVACINRRLRKGEIAVAKSRIAQAIAEGIQRLPAEVAIAAALHGVVLEIRQLANVFVKRNRQATSGVVAAAQCIGNGGATLLAGIP